MAYRARNTLFTTITLYKYRLKENNNSSETSVDKYIFLAISLEHINIGPTFLLKALTKMSKMK